MYLLFFFFNDTATTEIYTLSLHDALPISRLETRREWRRLPERNREPYTLVRKPPWRNRYTRQVEGLCPRSEEHTSELQSRQYLVCRLLLEKKKKNDLIHTNC